MSDLKKDLSKAEWSLMKICWKKGKASAREIYNESLHDKKRSYQTISTLLERIVKKGFLTKEKYGPIWIYKPALSQTKALSHEISTFITTILDESVGPLFVNFVKNKKLSREEIEEIKQIIRDKEKENSHDTS